jgi:benzoyl-CoA reductase/2-hydroxyglutaryl-CoA dehydratase subunit BcrC/BadD/HgdB
MEPEKAIEIVSGRLKEVKDELKAGDKPKVLVTGSVCPFVEVLTVFEEIGLILLDDMCTGTRFFTFNYPDKAEIKSVEDGIMFLVDKYFGKAPCPTKYYQSDQRFNHILEMAKQCDGVIFLLLKFCDPHFFDYPQIRERLEKLGKSTLLIELEFPVASLEQLRTRIEAFYELLAQKSE